MKASVTLYPNPFAPSEAVRSEVRRRTRIRHLAPRHGVTIAILNGRPVLRPAWRRKLSDGDALTFVQLPAGGGGTQGGSSPMRTLLAIALMAWTGGASFAAAFPGAVLGIETAKIAGLVVAVAGMSAINALFPAQAAASLPAASPTYTIDAQGNAARIGAVIPVQYGRMLSWPDLAAQPFTEYFGDEQYVYQLLALGMGDYAVEEIRIEDTPITSFAEVDCEVIPPGGDVTLFPAAVVTSTEVSGQELVGRKSATYAATGATVTVTETAHGRTTGQTIRLVDNAGGGAPTGYYTVGAVTAHTFQVTAPGFPASGSAYVYSMLGGATGFVVNASGSHARKIAVDLVLPYGLYHDTGSGTLAAKSVSVAIQIQPIDDAGAALGGWEVLAAETITDRSNTPLRRSFRYAVTPGRYRIRAYRADERSTADEDGHQVVMAGLRAYLTTGETFPGVTLIAVRMRATNNLSAQASRKIAVLATRKLPTWTGSAWSAPVATRSIAWAIADVARNQAYSAGLADREIDLAGLLALDAVWRARGDHFDHRFDQSGTWWDAVQTIARAGRAQCTLQGGVLRTVRDGAVSVPTVMFSERNIKAGSFAISYIHQTADTADVIKATYWDSQTWSEQTVTGKMPGSAAAKPAPLRLTGVTERAQALRDATYQAAANARRRRVVTFQTELEGRLPTFGELISIQHAMPGYGQQAEVLAWEPAARKLTLSEPLVWTAGRPHSLLLRRPTGSPWGPVAATRGASDYEAVLAAAPDFAPESGTGRVRTHVAFGADETFSALAKVARVTPRSLYDYEIEAVIEDPSVHTADQGIVAAPIVYSQLPRRVTQPVVAGLIARRISGTATRTLFSWAPAPDAVSYQLEMAEGDDPADSGVSWTRIADTTACSLAADLLYAARTMVRVRAMGLAAGPWVAATAGTLITDFWLSDETPFWLDDSLPFWSN